MTDSSQGTCRTRRKQAAIHVGEGGPGLDAKFDYYDVLGNLVPGTLLVCWVCICFPAATTALIAVPLPDAFRVVALTALAVFAGHLIQAVGSLAEPVLHRTWGGQPSERALTTGLGRYLPPEKAGVIAGRLADLFGAGQGSHALFLSAMQLTDAANVGRAARFNALYAYHRGLMVVVVTGIIMLLGSALVGGAASAWRWSGTATLLVVMLAVLALLWHRTRQRAYYYVREVLLAADLVLLKEGTATGSWGSEV